MSNTITLPISKEFFDHFEEANFELLEVHCPFVVLSRDELEGMRRTYAYDEEDVKANIVTDSQAREWATDNLNRINAVEAGMQADHEFAIGGFDLDEDYTEIPHSFVKSFKTEDEAKEYFDYLIFNEAMKMAAAKTNSEIKE